MDVIQREEYPSLKGRSRLAVYPGLKHSGRAYSRKWERQHWRLDLVLEHLAGYAVPRQVDNSGSVSVYNKTSYVGKRYSGKMVYKVALSARAKILVAEITNGNLKLGDLKTRGKEIKKDHDLAMELSVLPLRSRMAP
jgi:hypothetical protein